MGRAGITFSDVKRVADALVARGAQVTVQGVRNSLGTGSLSTVSRYLKEWQMLRGTDGEAAVFGLEDHLLQAVHQVYELLQTSARIELERNREQFSARVTEMTASYDALGEKQAATSRSLAEATGELDRLRERLAAAETLAQERLTQVRTLEAAAEVTTQSLAHRADEIQQLRAQVEQGRAQFHHYSEATNRNMQAERDAYESRIAGLEADRRTEQSGREQAIERCSQLRTRCTELETMLNNERAAHSSTRQELLSSRASEQAAQSSLAIAQSTLRHLEERLEEKRTNLDQAREKASKLTEEAQELRLGLASRDSQLTQMREQLVAAERRVDQLLSERTQAGAPDAPS